MLIHFMVSKEIYSNGEFKIFSCMPLEKYPDLLIHPVYHNFIIKGVLPYISVNNDYELDITLVDAERCGYKVAKAPKLELNINNLSYSQNFAILSRITTTSQAENILKVYPNFVQKILNNDVDDIDISKIKNVGDFRLDAYKREINAFCSSISLVGKLSEYSISLDESAILNKVYSKSCSSDDDIVKKVKENPYTALVKHCNRWFERADTTILEVQPELRNSHQRCEALVTYLLRRNEERNKSTYIDASELAEKIYSSYDEGLLDILQEVVENSEEIYFDTTRNRISLLETYLSEKGTVDYILNLLKNPIIWDFEYDKFKNIKDGVLTDEQSNLLKLICNQNIVCLNGSAGTGKSNSLKALLDMLDNYNKKYILLAPTGKASKRITESTEREASTIHRATNCGNKELTTDVLIIDEASMLSLEHMNMIVKSINCEKLLLIGDLAQLPTLSLGDVFREIINSNMVSINTLTKVFRQSEGGLFSAITSVRNGKQYINYKSNHVVLGTKQDYEFFKFKNDINQIVDTYIDLTKKYGCENVVMISPRNTGDFGCANLNNLIQKKINPITKNSKFMSRKITNDGLEVKFHKGDLVLVTKNNYNTESIETYKKLNEEHILIPTFNGEMGYVLSVNDDYLTVKIDENIVVFEQKDINNLLLGYVITTWKMQGSESDYVVLLTLSQHQFQHNRNLLYTGMSRAKKKLIEIGEPEAIQTSLERIATDEGKCQIKELLIE